MDETGTLGQCRACRYIGPADAFVVEPAHGHPSGQWETCPQCGSIETAPLSEQDAGEVVTEDVWDVVRRWEKAVDRSFIAGTLEVVADILRQQVSEDGERAH